jgi:uncharacterized DUF497 family protein
MPLEWDAKKAATNLEKHGVSFEEAATALLDPNALAMEDDASSAEPRWVLIGMTTQLRLVTVVYTVRDDESIRLISARKSTKTETNFYAQEL